ncbi:MAG: tRNA (adenosine(37)-N6)-dimethylallyltransferase MiaA [Chloroflexota bacterium]
MYSEKQKPLIVLLGPTGVGKTALSLNLCHKFDGEIVGADSRQIFKGMEVGTAQPTAEELAQTPHHLIGFRTPDEVLTLAEYQRLAYQTIDEIHARGHVPFLVGGTALYLRGVVLGLRIPQVPPNPAVRAELEAFLEVHGREALFERLQTVDPATAAVIDGKNPRRVLRALEIVMITGKPKVELEGADPPPYQILQIGLTRERKSLYQRIDQRVDEMVVEGLLEETTRLLDAGYVETLPAMTSLGYREMIAYLRDESTWAEAVEKVKVETHRFVRHQSTWFRKMDNIHWFDLDHPEEASADNTVAASIEALIADFLR